MSHPSEECSTSRTRRYDPHCRNSESQLLPSFFRLSPRISSMSKVTIELPDPKFKVGDFIHFTETVGMGSFDVTCRISHISMEGRWSRSDDGECSAQILNGYYAMAAQEGCKSKSGEVVRPGTVLTEEIAVLDEYGEEVGYTGIVWAPDTAENIGERWAEENK